MQYVRNRIHEPHTIDRAEFELILCSQIFDSDMNLTYKVAWCHTVSIFLTAYQQLNPRFYPVLTSNLTSLGCVVSELNASR